MYFQVHAGLSSLSLSFVMRAALSQSRSLIRFDFFRRHNKLVQLRIFYHDASVHRLKGNSLFAKSNSSTGKVTPFPPNNTILLQPLKINHKLIFRKQN